MEHDYIVHSVHQSYREREFEVDGETVLGRIEIVIVEAVDPQDGPTLTVHIPKRSYTELAPGDRIRVTLEKVEE